MKQTSNSTVLIITAVLVIAVIGVAMLLDVTTTGQAGRSRDRGKVAPSPPPQELPQQRIQEPPKLPPIVIAPPIDPSPDNRDVIIALLRAEVERLKANGGDAQRIADLLKQVDQVTRDLDLAKLDALAEKVRANVLEQQINKP